MLTCIYSCVRKGELFSDIQRYRTVQVRKKKIPLPARQCSRNAGLVVPHHNGQRLLSTEFLVTNGDRHPFQTDATISHMLKCPRISPPESSIGQQDATTCSRTWIIPKVVLLPPAVNRPALFLILSTNQLHTN